ncbi:MAG: hypothetical protein DI551_05980 [Micavibrio aeruginosavorus]|uniref:Uncharacterized protein n=1 Tax=Micavibrio aeruginosavorus TaxID=349221 RepID=A0A2W5N5I8_9BACT|nr:MAG: hypothetical protein DI551_05980 [Micavibrio aeruginosavorus]
MTYQIEAETNKVTYKANDNKTVSHADVSLPLPPLQAKEAMEVEIYARFMRHIRLVPNSRMEIKILSAIQFTSDMMDLNDAIVAKTLADMGLRAPRRAFPESYLEHVDRSLMRSGWDVGGPCASSIEMKSHWDNIGEDKFAAYRREYSILSEPARV